MTNVLEFLPMSNADPSPGLVIQLPTSEGRYLRVTHVFKDSVYVMWVGMHTAVREARRPIKKTNLEIERLIASGASWGRLSLPAIFTTPPPANTEHALTLAAAWDLISPLITAFDRETNLARFRFTMLIRLRAEETQSSVVTLTRIVLRYYYFGRTRFALLKLPPGKKPGEGTYTFQAATRQENDALPKRRGRKGILSEELGLNDFIVSEDDIDDMIATLQTLLRSGPTNKTAAHEEYLAKAFRHRHPTVYDEYIAGNRPEPVTCRQYRYYIDGYARLGDDLARNLRSMRQSKGYLGSLHSSGPGEVYEIDSTGGRIHLVTAGDAPVLVGKPTIYVVIDRWSRFVVSAYLSLRAPSYEEVRHALLVAFTSRERRFRGLGVDIDDTRWPVGRMPAVICPDRGSEYLCNSMEQAVVSDLRIELTPLPPYCPDGKAIVERLIREIKRRMSATRMKGTFADRPLNPETKKASERAKEAAVHTIADAYRALIEIIQDHNNRPHTALKRRRILTQAGVAPTPKAAYLWGLEHITGIRAAPFSDSDYKRLLLATDSASISSGVLRYKDRPYLPANALAEDIARRSTSRAKQISVRVDKTDPREIFIVDQQGRWASFNITRGGDNDLAGITLDEEECLSTQSSRLWAKSEHESRVSRVAAKEAAQKARKKTTTTGASIVSREEQHLARVNETASMKSALTEQPKSRPATQPTRASDWARIEEEEQLRLLETVRKNRRKL